MTDPFDVLRAPTSPVEPDPAFAGALRSRVERALLDPEDSMTSTETSATAAESLRLHAITPYLAVAGARAAVAFYIDAFDAVQRGEPIMMPDGRVGHVEVAIGDSVLMLADEFPEIAFLSPATRGGPSQSLRLEVPDPDAVVGRAVAGGAVLERPVTDEPYGRGGVVIDPFGHRWMVSRGVVGPRPGDVVYASLWTPDADRARAFYGAVLGPASRVGMSGGHAGPTLMACYVVPDLDEAVALARAAGGTAGEPRDEPYGRVADCVDDHGLPFAVWAGTSGTAVTEIAHLDIRVPDARRARAFYGTVLGWRFTPGRALDAWSIREVTPRISITGGAAGASVSAAFTVADLPAAARAVRAAGGTSAEPSRRASGTTVECTDDQGTSFELHHP